MLKPCICILLRPALCKHDILSRDPLSGSVLWFGVWNNNDRNLLTLKLEASLYLCAIYVAGPDGRSLAERATTFSSSAHGTVSEINSMANNTTIVETVSWQKNEGRGTWDIISSCILTLVLCVWTALHLNVPKQNATLWDRFKTKTLWVIVGIFAPEMVVYIAWIQYSSAKYLLEKIQEFGADGTDLSKKRGKCGGSRGDSEVRGKPSTILLKSTWLIAGIGSFPCPNCTEET